MKIPWLPLCLLASTATAFAHVNDRGMDYERYKDRYGVSCCGVQDCRPADDFVEAVINGEHVVRLLLDRGWVTVPHSFVIPAPSTDERAHFCGELYVPGSDPAEVKAAPTCVILPPRST
jgi:hypothetical protein